MQEEEEEKEEEDEGPVNKTPGLLQMQHAHGYDCNYSNCNFGFQTSRGSGGLLRWHSGKVEFLFSCKLI